MALKGSRDTVLVVFLPPLAEMETNSFLTIHGTRRTAGQIGPRDADPAPELPRRNALAAFVLVPWVEDQLMVF